MGIAEGGEIEAESFDFAPRRAKTNFCELNLKNKKRIKFVFGGIEKRKLSFALSPRFWQYRVELNLR
ncbi:hypothetical protein DQ356_00535 [Chryseobacterium lacus]|uniref:Uncharacterized protein n=1 Tax=Chryseobacterium lacus TaxID=2058346 RepID=A0A368N3G3_9FLAO|nr:hypothetical protein DQ356_00535 [Chryseobacterium lacus]